MVLTGRGEVEGWMVKFCERGNFSFFFKKKIEFPLKFSWILHKCSWTFHEFIWIFPNVSQNNSINPKTLFPGIQSNILSDHKSFKLNFKINALALNCCFCLSNLNQSLIRNFPKIFYVFHFPLYWVSLRWIWLNWTISNRWNSSFVFLMYWRVLPPTIFTCTVIKHSSIYWI